MKTTELNYKSLMIGDLVSYNGTPIKVENIHGDCINYSPDIPYVQEEFFIDIADVKPIPLTAEILEMNGFTENYRYDDLSYIQSNGTVTGTHINGENGEMEEMYFKYVHEVQNALRLCGLNNLADNIKLEE